MARNSFKTFNKVFSLADLTTTSVTLTNTAGSAILCNYIQLESRSIAGDDLGYFHLFPNGIYQNDVSVTSTSATIGAAGTGGVVGVADGAVEYLVPNKIGVSSVQIRNHLGGQGTFVLKYGILTSANDLNDNLMHRYNTGKES